MAIKSLYDIYNQKSDAFLQKLLNSHVIIDDDIPGSFFSVKRNEQGGWNYYKKNEPITLVDRTISKFYEQAISVFENMPQEKILNIPQNLIFVMKYIHVPIASGESVLSNQILKLTHVIDDNTKQVINDEQSIGYWANHLGIGLPPILFDGKLNDEQKAAILDFVYTNQEELSQRFRSESFTEYILSVLNSSYISQGINSIVFRFEDEDSKEEVLAKIIDPLFYELQRKNPKTEVTKSDDIIYIIVLQLINFIESYPIKDLMSIVDNNLTFEQNYIAIMNKIFCDYIDNNSADVIGLDLKAPTYFIGNENELNLGLIDDQKVIELVDMNNNFKEIYRILLNFFRKKRKKAKGLLNENMLKLFNALVDKIHNIISGKSLYEQYTPTFEEYVGLISEDYSFNYMRQNGGIQNQFAMHQRRKPVNIIVDYFQPINKAHVSIAETLYKKNKLKTLFILLDNKQCSPIKPFSTETAEKLLKKFFEGNQDFVSGYVVVEKNTIDQILKSICDEYIPVLWAANASKIDEYTIEMDYARRKNTKFNISKRFKLIIAPELNNNRILDFIQMGNYAQFKELTPKEIHADFYELQKELKKNLVNNAENSTFV